MSPLPSLDYARIARKGKRFSVTSGPWTHVNDAEDPGEERLSTLYEGQNCVFTDSAHGAGVSPRLGIQGLYASLGGAGAVYTNQLGTGGGSPNRDGQGVCDHTDGDGTIRRFFFVGNKMYRWNGDVSSGSTLTDVTPVGVTIAPGTSQPRVYWASLAGKLIVTDGVNRPWVGTNLGATPITGTYIDFDGAGNAWKTLGAPTVFGGSVAFIANTLNGVDARDTILWSAPADPTVGYKQTNYANYWELFQTETNPLTAILGTNGQFYYFRAKSIGAVTGATLNTAKAAATHDAVSTLVGCTNAATVVLAGEVIFFADESGRPHRMDVGGKPEDLSWQMRRAITALTYLNPGIVARRAWATYVPDVNLVAFCLWGPDASTTADGTSYTLYVFSATTGAYQGFWIVGGGRYLDIGGVIRDTSGNARLYLIGTNSFTLSTTRDPTVFGYVYQQEILGRTTIVGSSLAAQSADGFPGTSTSLVSATAMTHGLGYDDKRDKLFDLVTAAVSSAQSGSTSHIALDYSTPRRALTSIVETTFAGLAENDSTLVRGAARVAWGVEARGRYLRARVYFPYTSSWQYPAALFSVRADGAYVSTDPGAP